MQVRPAHWIALGLALALGVAVCDGFRVRDRYSVAVGKYQEADKIAKADATVKDSLIVEQKKVIAAKDQQIANIIANAGQPSALEVVKDKVIAAQQKKIADYEAQGDLRAALEASKAESRDWAEKFTLAEERHAQDIFNLNAAWQAKDDAQVAISNAWKAKYESEARLRSMAEKNWKGAETKLKWTRTVSNIEKLVIGGIAGKLIYDKLKGK